MSRNTVSLNVCAAAGVRLPPSRKEAGARQLSVLYSLITTCRLQGVDPYAYLVGVLQRVNTHPARWVHELTPRQWKERFADDLLPSLMGMVQKKRRAASKA